MEEVNSLFRKMKGVISALPAYVHMEPLGFCRNNKPAWADDVVWLNISMDEKILGNLALLSKKAALGCGIKNSAVMIFELDIDSLQPYPSRTNKFVNIPEFPMTDYDLSLLFDLNVKWDDILGQIKINEEGLLRKVLFVDEYLGKQVPDGKKSLTLRLVIGS